MTEDISVVSTLSLFSKNGVLQFATKCIAHLSQNLTLPLYRLLDYIICILNNRLVKVWHLKLFYGFGYYS